LAIYSKIAPKIMRWYYVFGTNTYKKWMKKPNQSKNFQNVDEIAKIWMKILHMNGCKVFSNQNINECRNM
jgi:hypothetical protein